MPKRNRLPVFARRNTAPYEIHIDRITPLVELLDKAATNISQNLELETELVAQITNQVVNNMQLVSGAQKLGCRYAVHMIAYALEGQDIRNILNQMSEPDVCLLQTSFFDAQSYEEPDLSKLDTIKVDSIFKEKVTNIYTVVSVYWKERHGELAKWCKELADYKKEKENAKEQAEKDRLTQIEKEEEIEKWEEKMSEKYGESLWSMETLRKKLLEAGFKAEDMDAVYGLKNRLLRKYEDLKATVNSYFRAVLAMNGIGTAKMFRADCFKDYVKLLKKNNRRMSDKPSKKRAKRGSVQENKSGQKPEVQSALNIKSPKDQLDVKALLKYLEDLQSLCDQKENKIKALDDEKEKLQKDIKDLKEQERKAKELLNVQKAAEAAVAAANAKIAEFMQTHK
ncbi:MAG: hypothetical protein J6Y07_00630 [Alphaproteobacteria bacterium]|nr:hypothetical protein [Alphaproteobacteria bacterium]